MMQHLIKPTRENRLAAFKDNEMIKENIRAFEIKKDMEGAIRCFNEGFEHILWPSIKYAKPSLHEDFIKFFYKMSTDCFVAEVDGEICGIIFGAAPFKIKSILNAILFYLLYVIPRGLVNSYGMNWLAYKHFFQLIYGYLPFFFLHPNRWPMCEVALFTSINKYRSRGLGRRLMDRFISTVRAGSYEGASVCTDTALSYRFYEVYGFELEKSFIQRSYKYSIPHISFKALIYYLKI
jgi:GNAT superfamily N-acetyltransferase